MCKSEMETNVPEVAIAIYIYRPVTTENSGEVLFHLGILSKYIGSYHSPVLYLSHFVLCTLLLESTVFPDALIQLYK